MRHSCWRSIQALSPNFNLHRPCPLTMQKLDTRAACSGQCFGRTTLIINDSPFGLCPTLDRNAARSCSPPNPFQTELSLWNCSLAHMSKSPISSIASHAAPDAAVAASNFASSEAIDWTTPADRHGRKTVSFAAATSFTTAVQVLLKERDSLIHGV